MSKKSAILLRMKNYRPKGLFRSFSQAELEKMLEDVKAKFLDEDGSEIKSWSTGGHQVTSEIPINLAQRLSEIMHALSKLDPDKYPPRLDRSTVRTSSEAELE